ncbi:MAG: DUF3302 domain-containing protein [Filomicrobium sp.]
MSGLDIFAIIVLLILLFAALGIWVALAMLPGKIAKNRGHPQAEAINIGGWLGALLGGVLWPVFLIWAFTKPVRIETGTVTSSELNALRDRLNELEANQTTQRGQTS